MEHIYQVVRQHQTNVPSNFEWLAERSPVMTISSQNTLAFTAYCDLAKSLSKLVEHQVYVADLNVPWEAHKVLSHTTEITCLEWDVSGTKLLIADAAGTIQIWTMKDFLLNEWQRITNASFPGECIISAAYFHSGKKIGLIPEKKEAVNYFEKFQHLKFGPSVKQMGGRPLEGCIAIGCSGMVCVVVQHLDGSILACTELLGQFRCGLKVVDICYAKNGDFLVVTSEGSVDASINCFHVTLKVDQKNCSVRSQPFSSFYLDCFTTTSLVKVTHLKFVLREAADAVVVAAAGTGGSVVELWQLQEKTIQFHKMFNEQVLEPRPNTVGWHHHASFTWNEHVVAVATPRLSILDTSPPPSNILVAYKDNSIKCFSRETMHQASYNITLACHRRDIMGATIKDMQLTWTGCALLAIDSLSQLFLYSLSPSICVGRPLSINSATTILEFCLVTGTDWLDVILSLKPNLIESLCEKLSEIFNQQSIGTQTYLQNRFYSMKGALYRCLSNGQARAGDCHAQIMLNAVSTALKSMLRPRDLSSQDKGPSETLSGLLATAKPGTDKMDKVLLLLEHKEFTVEPPILQSLKYLTQWVADLALHLIAALTNHHSDFPGAGLLSDPKAINTLRELLVIVRIWGFLNEGCLPMFTRLYADNVDVLAALFKLLTKLLSMGGEPDEALLEECNHLTSQVIVPSLEFGINAKGVCSPALYLNTLPLVFEYNRYPEFMDIKPSTSDIIMPPHHKTDIVRHVALGTTPANFRQCTRCFSSSLFKANARSAATRAWDQRWARLCPCGGHWRFRKEP